MGGKQRGPICTSTLGSDWIDEGTTCRSRSGSPGPLGNKESPAVPHSANERKQQRSGPAVAVKPFSGTGPNSHLGKGLSAILVTDLFQVQGSCKLTIVEWERRADIEREIELTNAEGFDPETRIPRGHLIAPDIFVTGSVTTTETTTSWDVKLVNAKTGTIIGNDSGHAKGAALFDASAGIAQRLLNQICAGWLNE